MNNFNSIYSVLLSIIFFVGILSCSNVDNGSDDDKGTYNGYSLNEDTIKESISSFPEFILKTPGNLQISSRTEYVDSSFLQVKDEGGNITFSSYCKIKGRGNSTWIAPKKPYAFKLYKKSELMGLPSEKSWVLLANYYDPTHLRNSVASYISSRISNLEFTPHFIFLNLNINDEYKGIYQIGEKVKAGKNRVNVGDRGFLLEIDGKADNSEPTFATQYLKSKVNIKEPDVVVGDNDFEWIKDYVLRAEEVLYSDYFCDKELGYKNYFDIESFVDWYLINEIAKNGDSKMFSSCYMNITRDGKLKMGPIWDFDTAFGNYIFDYPHKEKLNQTNGYWIKDAPWFERFFLDPEFVQMVKNRFLRFYHLRHHIYEYIDIKSNEVKGHICRDNELWHGVAQDSANNDDVINAYNKKVEEMKEWIENRYQWLYQSIIINELKYEE